MVVVGTPAAAFAQEETKLVAGEEETPAEEYVKKDTIEVGGSIGGSWAGDVFTLTASPTVGYFIVDRVELSLSLNITYIHTEDSVTGMSSSAKNGALVLEPSYHHPLSEDMLVLAGLGIGSGWDGDDFDFELIPHVGLNFITSRSSVITPSIRVPILIGKAHGMDDDVGTDVGITFDVGITTTW